MARNKYPEVTEERILEAAQRLFLEKGYDRTTIQDIVNELGGLTKGAVYHHFKSKEDSLHTEYPKEIAELLPLLTSLWLMPSVFPATKAEMRRKFTFLGEMLDRMGVPLFDEGIRALVDQFFDQIPETE